MEFPSTVYKTDLLARMKCLTTKKVFTLSHKIHLSNPLTIMAPLLATHEHWSVLLPELLQQNN